MPVAPSPAQQAASRANGARSRGPATDAGKARAARNGTRHGLRGGAVRLLPGEDADEFAQLHAAVAADWRPRDAYERRWVRELVAAMWRQERLRGLELAALAAAEQEQPAHRGHREAAAHLRPLRRPDRQGHDQALRALRVLRDRPDAAIAEAQEGTSEPDERATQTRNCTNELSTRTSEPEPELANENFTNEFAARTSEPEPAPPEPRRHPARAHVRTRAPSLATRPASPPAPLNRHERRRLKALERRAA